MRERGLKSPKDTTIITDPNGRSREGAWIEMKTSKSLPKVSKVAPVRERGLKVVSSVEIILCIRGRSREGAWIESYIASNIGAGIKGRSREGAWIEMQSA